MSLNELIEIETKELGTRETGINYVKYNDVYWGQGVGGPDYPWCVVFQWWCAKKANIPFPDTAHCRGVREYAQKKGQWVIAPFKAGDFVIIGGDSHIGLVIEANGDNLITIEGNYGDSVKKVNRNASEFVGAYRPVYDEEFEPAEEQEEILEDIPHFVLKTVNCNSYYQKLPEIAIIQGILKKYGYDCGYLDGETGPKTRAMVRNFQFDRKLDVDGIVGPSTWSELFMGVDW